MTIQPIGSASVALYITPADLKEHGLTPAGLTLEQALELTRTAFRQAGMDLEGSIEIEAYPESCGVLVFAHVRPPEQRWFSFACLEDLAAAARVLDQPRPDAALLWWEGRWWLSFAPEAVGAAACMSEFGSSQSARPHLEATLAQVRFEPLAELLYREWLGEARSQWPEAAATEWRDDRFDQAILLDNGTGSDGRANQILVARRGGVVLRQIVQFRGDLTDHLDDYAAVLAEFQ